SGTFGSCSNLESVTVEGATGVTFGSNAFSSSGKLRTVDVDTYVTVHENAFRGQTGLESIAHGSADAPVRGFDALSAFAGCTALRSVLIDSPDEGVVTVHESMFDGSGITKVVFGKPVSIKARAFSGCDRLVHVEGAAIAEMKENAFAGCVRLETLDATVGDLSEADNAFSGCTRLCEVHLVADALPECVLPNGMFSGCSLLVGVTVDLRGDSSRSPSVLVSPTAFQNCSQLVSVEFLNTSSGTVYFSDNAFSGCSLLADVVVGDASQEHPVLATKNAFRGLPSLVGVHAYDGSDAVVEIDGDGAYAFAGCTALRSVSLAGDTVYEHMFEGSGLVSAPEMASADVAVHQNAFANCSKMKEFSPAYSVAIVGIGAFEGCPSVEEMDLHFIQNYGFDEIYIPNGTFAGCIGLKNIRMDMSHNDFRLDTSTFASCSILETVFIDNAAEVTVCPNAFSSGGSLKEFRVSADVPLVVQNNAFRGQIALIGIFADEIGYIDAGIVGDDAQYAFAGCTNLTSIRICDDTVYEHMFDGAGLLYNPIFDSSEIVVQDRAFANCVRMMEFRTDVPVMLEGTYVFAGCTALEVIDVTLIEYDSDGICYVPDGTFAGCSTLKTVVLDTDSMKFRLDTGIFGSTSSIQTLTVTGSDTVIVCPNVFASSGTFTDFIVDDGVYVIVENNAFRNQTSLTGIHTASADAPVIGHDAKYAFAGCTDLESILLCFEDPVADNYVAESMFEGSGLVNVDIRGPVVLKDRAFANCSQLIEVNEGLDTVKIYSNVFAGCTNLTVLHISVDDLSEADNTFAGCTKLKEVFLDGASDTTVQIPYGFFSGCSNMQMLTFNGDFHLVRNVFNGCDRLDTVYATEDGLSIVAEAFRGAPNLENVYVVGTVVPAKVTVIGTTDYAFYGSVKLRNVLVGVDGDHGVIGSYMFYNCSELNDVFFDKDVVWEGFGDYAFSGCSVLRGMYMSDGSPVLFNDDVYISMNTFSGCGSLEEISIGSIGKKVFFGNSSVVNNGSLRRVAVTGASEVVFDEQAFNGCPALTEISATSDMPGAVVTLNDHSLSGVGNLQVLDVGDMLLSIGYRSLENLVHLSVVETEGVVYIGDYGLYNCGLLSGITLDPAISYLGDYAFARCSELEVSPISETALKSIGKYAFMGCVKIASLEFSRSEIVTIGEGAFSSCSKLRSVELPSTLKTIGDKAFEDCSQLGQIDFSGLMSLETIGDSAFKSTSISSIEFPAGLKRIGDSAFYGCQRIVTVVFGGSLESVGNYAFCDCSLLGSLNLPKGVKFIGDSAFRGCASLRGVDLSDIDSFRNIPDRVFSECSKLEYVLLPNGVRSIGDWAFYKCVDLVFIDFADGNSVTHIGEGSFSGCSMVVTLEFPAVRHIGPQAFSGCSSLHSLTLSSELEGGSVIGSHTFDGCESLASIVVPDNVVGIDEYAFAGCIGLKNVKLPSTVRGIDAGAFEICVSLVSIDGDGCRIARLGIDAFNGCQALEVLDLEFGCTLPEKAFEGCVSLKALDLSGCTGPVPTGLANGCTSLETVRLPYGCSGIGDHAFDGCSMLVLPVDTVLADDLAVGNYAFNGCTSLSLFPGCNIVSLGEYAFNGCERLDLGLVEFALTVVPDYAFAGCFALTDIPVDARFYGAHSFEGVALDAPLREVVLMNAETIGDYAFCNVKNLLFSIGDRIVSVGDHAFENAGFSGNLYSENLSDIGAYAFAGCGAVHVYIYSGNADGFSLGEHSFAGCPELRTVKIRAANLVEFSTSAFDDCPKLESIDLGDSFVQYNGALYTPDMKTLYKVVQYIEGVYELHPDTEYIEGYAFKGCDAVTSIRNTGRLIVIGDHAFEDCTSLSYLDLPKVTRIGTYAFSGSGIVSVDWNNITSIPEGLFKDCSRFNSVSIVNGSKSIGKYAFEGCVSLSGVNLSRNIAILDDGCFKGCTGIEGTLTIPSTVLVLGKGVFEGCTGIEEVSFNHYGAVPADCFKDCTSLTTFRMTSGPTEIRSDAFRGCGSLNDIVVPNTVTYLGDGVFAGCTSLVYLLLPENLTSIGDELFKGCTVLEYIDVPKNVTSIGDSAFEACVGLIKVDLHNSVRTIGEHAFDGCSALVDVDVPNSVSFIGPAAFKDCISLNMFDLPDLTNSIEDETFMGCTSLTGVILHQNVRNIGDRAFSGDIGLVGLSGTDGLIHVGSFAFEDCRMLQSFSIGGLMESISYEAFAGCTSLLTVYVDPENRNFGSDGTMVYEYQDGEPFILLKVLPGDDVVSITVPAKVAIVSPMAIYGLSSLRDVDFLGNVGLIGDHNFELCPKLDTITITSDHYCMVGPALMDHDETRILAVAGDGILVVPATVDTIDAGAFLNMGRCKDVSFEPGNLEYILVDGVIYSTDGSILYRVLDPSDRFIIPSGIRTVWTYAFADSGVTALYVTEEATFMTDSIYRCPSLVEMYVGDKDTVFQDSSINPGTRGSPVVVHITSEDGYRVPDNALGPYTKVDYSPLVPETQDDTLLYVIVIAVVVVSMVVVGFVVYRKRY
ncbi:MAG: leucine-rich repeat domain-containing protein, partial [archaeon]|nr:leucine-rich repeat domain-containing protein [archaeon]